MGFYNVDVVFYEVYVVGNVVKVLCEFYEVCLFVVMSLYEGDAKLFRAYVIYIDFEMVSGFLDRVVYLYECVFLLLLYVVEFWWDYVLYVWLILFKLVEVVLRILMFRVVRMCSFSVLWKLVFELELLYDLYMYVLRMKFRDLNDYGVVFIKVFI